MPTIPSTVMLLRFDGAAGVLPSDELGNLDNLRADAATTAPAPVASWCGVGRQFVQANSDALIATDLSDNGTLLTRDLTIQAILSLTVAGASGPMTVIARGDNDGSPSEQYAYGLELEQVSAGVIQIRMFWQTLDGNVWTAMAGAYQHPGDGAEILITATRRWENTGSVVVRYYAGDQLLAEVSSTDGNIGGGTTGHTTVGGRKSAGAWSRFFNGTIDEIAVLDYEMSAEELHQIWLRMTVYQPAGVDQVVANVPPGAPWANNLGNKIGSIVRMTGQVLAQGPSAIEEMRALWLPDAPVLENIGRWEQLRGITALPSDSLDTRRVRLLANLSRQAGFSLPALQLAFSGPLQVDPSDVQLLEFTNTITDGFATLSSQRWSPSAHGTWAAVAGELAVTIASGTDLRWDVYRNSSYLVMPLSGPDSTAFILQAKLSTLTALPVNTIAGLWTWNFRSGQALWFGIANVGGTNKLGYRVYSGGTLGAFNAILSPAPATPIWLRMYPNDSGSGLGGPNELAYLLSYSTSGPSTGYVDTDVFIPQDTEWAGFGVMSTDAATAGAVAATFDDVVLITPNGDRPFNWYAYRDPALPGTADLVGANALAKAVTPAHVFGAAIGSLSVLCDDPLNGLCDRGPLGAL